METLNPYQPPQFTEPVAKAYDVPVMSVRYSAGYSIYLSSMGVFCIVMGIPAWQLVGLASLLFVVSGIAHLALGLLVGKRPYFEVFEDRVEFPSPAFPRWRSVRPLASIGARSFHRWVAKREDFERFIAWREGSEKLPEAR